MADDAFTAVTQARFRERRTQRYHVVHNKLYATLTKEVLPGCQWTSDNDQRNIWETVHLIAMEAGRAMANLTATRQWAPSSATSCGVAQGF